MAKKVQPNGVNPKTETKTKTKKNRVKLIPYPIKEGQVIETAIPEGFEWKTHKPIVRKNFSNPGIAVEHKGLHLKYQAGLLTTKVDKMAKAGDKMLVDAEALKKLGDTKQQKKVAQAQRVATKLQELRKELAEAGVDVDALLSSDEDEAEAEATETK